MMRTGRSNSAAGKTEALVVSGDKNFAEQAGATFGSAAEIAVRVVNGSLAMLDGKLDLDGVAVAVVDLDSARADEMDALERLMLQVGTWPPVVVVTEKFDAALARTL